MSTTRFSVLVLLLSMTTGTAASDLWLDQSTLASWGYQSHPSNSYACAAGQQATVSQLGLKAIKIDNGLHHRFTLVREQYAYHSEAVARIVQLKQPSDDVRMLKDCGLSRVFNVGRAVYIVNTDVARSYAEVLPSLAEKIKSQMTQLGALPQPAITAAQLPVLPTDQERRQRAGYGEYVEPEQACTEISVGNVNTQFNQGRLDDDNYFISWQHDLNDDGICEALLSKNISGLGLSPQQWLVTSVTPPINTNAAIITAEAKPETLRVIGHFEGNAVNAIAATKGGFNRVEMRRPIGDDQLQYRLYSKAARQDYKLRWIDLYQLQSKCNCYQFVRRQKFD